MREPTVIVDGLRIECLDSSSKFAEALPRLIEFASKVEPERVVQHPVWLHSELSNSTGLIQPLVIVAYLGNEIAGYAPLLLHPHVFRALSRIPVYRGTIARLLGYDIVAQPECVDRLRSHVLDWLRKRGIPLLLQEVPVHGGFADAARKAGFNALRINPLPQRNWHLTLPKTFSEYQAKFKPKTRKNFEYRARRIALDMGGDIELFQCRKREDVERYSRLVAALYPKTWQSAEHPKDWTSQPVVSHVQSLAAHGWMRAFVLLAKGQPVAFAHGYQSTSRYELDEIGYDPEFEKYSPGSLLIYLSIRQLLESEAAPNFYSFGFGDNKYKTILANGSEDAASYLVVSGVRTLKFVGLPMANGLYRLAKRVRPKIRRAPQPAQADPPQN